MSVPNKIRRFRLAHRLTLAQLAEELNVTEATVSRWETGDRAVPDSMKLALAEYFKVSVPVIFEFTYDVSADTLGRLLDALTAEKVRNDQLTARLDSLEAEIGALRGRVA